MMIAKRLGTVRKRYKKMVRSRGVNGLMLTKYLTKQDCPVILSITETHTETSEQVVIQRNQVRETGRTETTDIYLRAREIYFRARRHRPVRAASIF